MKICPTCKIDKPLQDYLPTAKKPKGQPYCTPCRAAYHAEYHRANPHKSRQTTKKYDKENRDKRRVHEEKYKKSNPDKVREWSRRKNRKREALKKNNWHDPYTEEQVLTKYGIDCHICKTLIDLSAPRQCGKPGWEKGLHIDHLHPLSKGGPDTLYNVRPSHGKCNIDKNAKLGY
jgi:5-methylcytosine-specific restriction endonuclease McrA